MNTFRIASLLALALSFRAGPADAQNDEDIVGVAVEAGIFTTLVAAVRGRRAGRGAPG